MIPREENSVPAQKSSPRIEARWGVAPSPAGEIGCLSVAARSIANHLSRARTSIVQATGVVPMVDLDDVAAIEALGHEVELVRDPIERLAGALGREK